MASRDRAGVAAGEPDPRAAPTGVAAGQRVAKLATDPNRFLAAVQIGVTSTALLSSAFGAVTLSDQAASGLRSLGVAHDWPVRSASSASP